MRKEYTQDELRKIWERVKERMYDDLIPGVVRINDKYVEYVIEQILYCVDEIVKDGDAENLDDYTCVSVPCPYDGPPCRSVPRFDDNAEECPICGGVGNHLSIPSYSSQIARRRRFDERAD